LEKYNGIIKLKVCYFDMSEFYDFGDWENYAPTQKLKDIEKIFNF